MKKKNLILLVVSRSIFGKISIIGIIIIGEY